MTDLLPGLVVWPVLGAVVPPLAARVRSGLGWWVALATLLGQAVLAGTVGWLVLAGGARSYALGAVAPPAGIELVVDAVSVAFVGLVALVALALLAYTRSAGPRSAPFYSLYLLLVAGLTGICVTGDVFNLYVFLEVSGLAAYGLVAQGRGGRAALASLQYLLLGTVGASLYLLGVAYAYVATGTLNMADLAARLPIDGTLTLAAFAFILVGLGVKVALFPLHVWQPDAYDRAPTGVAALLSALVSTVAAYALVRVVFDAFPVGFLDANAAAGVLVLALGGASVLAGGLLALRADRVRRLFAYSSVAQFGLVVLGIGVANGTALLGVVVHLLGHALMKGGLFAAAGVLAARSGAETVDGFTGLGRRFPTDSATFAVLALGLVGLPPTAGFVGKYYIALGALEAGAWLVLGLVLVSTLLSLAYFGRLLDLVYTGDDTQVPTAASAAPATQATPGMRGVAVGAAAVTLLYGLAVAAVAGPLEPAVTALLQP